MDEKEIARLVRQAVFVYSDQSNQQKASGTKKENSGTYETANITLSAARRLIRKVEQKAEQMGLSVVAAVSNSAARLVAVECMDDSYIASYDIATGKAYTVVALKMPTTDLKQLCQPGAPLYGLQQTNEGKIVIFGGGVPLWYHGRLIGGLGVSGGSEEQDTMLAEYGASVLEEAVSCAE